MRVEPCKAALTASVTLPEYHLPQIEMSRETRTALKSYAKNTMLCTGNSCGTAPEDLANFDAHHLDVPVYTAAIDRQLNEHGYIVPGLGDAGERIFGTK